MGMNVLRRSCTSCTPTSQNAVVPNPNPGQFRVLSTMHVGSHVVARIRYLGCTNFEGVKICVYLNTKPREIRNAALLDPHFSETGLSPFARFTPTKEGLTAAVMLARILPF